MKKRDILIIIVVLAVAVGLLAARQFLTAGGEEDRVEVYLDSKLYQSLPLDQNTVLEIKQDDGGFNLVEIKDGVVRMMDANCPGQDCVHMRPMSADDLGSKFGVIVCLPHRVSLELHLAGGAD